MFAFPTLILFLNICIFVLGMFLIAKILPFHKRYEVRWLIAMTAALSVISFCSLNVYIQASLEDKIFFSRLRFIGLSILGQSWFFFLVLTYTRQKFFRKPWVVLASLSPGLVTIAFALNPRWNEWLTSHYEVFEWQGATLVKFAGGDWFPVHILSANFFAIAAIVFLLSALPRATGVKRKQLAILVLGGTVSLFVDTYSVFTNSPLRWAMISSGTFVIVEAAILFAIHRHGLLDLSPIAKDWIFREIPDPILILDDQERILDFNDAAEASFHIVREDRGLPWTHVRKIASVRLDQPVSEWNFIDEQENSHSFQIHVIGLDSRHSVAGRIIFFRDISAQKQIEDRLNGDLDFKARLLSLIAHDFSALLQTQSYLSTHLHKEVQPELRREATALSSISLASQDLMTNILRWTRAQKKELLQVQRPFEINTLVKEVINNLEGTLLIKEIGIDFHSQEYPLIFNGDSVMIESVLRNLLTNAIHASSPKMKIGVSLNKDSNHLTVSVKDDGVGMSPELLNLLRNSDENALLETRGSASGFGIGLRIARRFIALHRGTLEFVSEEGKGTSVTFTLPLQEPSS